MAPARTPARTAAKFAALALMLSSTSLFAGGPRLVAGSTYFNPGVMGTPIHWANGKLYYYVDQGPLSATVTNQQAVAMVDAAAALWNAVPTAGVSLVDKGPLNEDVNGSNILPGNNTLLQPADVSSSATKFPLGVIFDADGSVLEGVLGNDVSDPTNCENYGVTIWTDNINRDATIAHAIMILNGRCTDTDMRLSMMSFLIERAFGEILGLGFSQVFSDAIRTQNQNEMQAWPIMQPGSGGCGFTGGVCIPNPGVLHYDDIAAINRLYPITDANLAAFPGKTLTAASTVSIRGSIAFRSGLGMEGVNVVAVPLDAGGDPMPQYAVTAVSGATFSGNQGNEVTGWTDQTNIPYTQWGSTDPSVQGLFDLGFIPLPPGITSAAYQLTFESINPLYIYEGTVGPYVLGSPTPSGTLNPISIPSLAAGASKIIALNVSDSATGGFHDAISTEQSPRLLPASGLWSGRLDQPSQSDWFVFPIRGNRTFTVVTLAVDERGAPTGSKAMPVLGIWDAFAPVGSAAAGSGPGLNGWAIGESWLRITSSADDVVRLGIADMRGDGRPDYAYNGWVLYADSVQPQRLPASGGPIVIRGMGFRQADTVLVGGQLAQVTSVSPNEITAIAPPAARGVTGSVDVEVDDLPIYYAQAILTGGISYDAGNGDSLTLVTAPSNTVPIGAPIPFTVTALGSNLTPAGGVTVTYTVTSGTAALACGKTTCSVIATGDGSATMNVTAVDTTLSVVTASLTNGASLQAHFTGGAPAVLSALNPSLSIAAGTSAMWTTQALALKNGSPAAGQSVAWQCGAGLKQTITAAVVTSSSGIAAKALSVGPLTPGQQASASACLNGTQQCVNFSALGARPEYAWVEPVSGTAQSVAVTDAPSQIVLRVRDMNGNPMAGGTVTLFQTIYAWAPPCPPHGRCAQPQFLGTQTAAATSALDGTVTFTPATLPGVATNIIALASTGNTSTLNISLEQHP
ncbi:MAG TPA: IPT/TIG domain-containing protein [Terracidiphilus sp.]|nr:IPT/TIG domain-containing protein [Terracidiphilus sp.]